MERSNHGAFAHAWAALRLRCARCCRGRVWRGPFRMNSECAACGLRFEREPGYFTGAMYASYTIGIFAIMPVWIAMLASGVGLAPIMTFVVVALLLVAPVSFHYSRVLWMHVDCYFNPESFER